MRRAISLFVALFVLSTARGYAQFMDEEDTDQDWGMFLEDEPEKPKHKVYNNACYVNLPFVAARYRFGELPGAHFTETAIGYFRSLQILEEKPYFVELGGEMKYSRLKDAAEHPNWHRNLLTLRIPISVTYKFYPWKKRELALTPFAGAYFRAIVAGKPDANGPQAQMSADEQMSTNEQMQHNWSTCQLGWHAGLRLYAYRFYFGASYSRDFPDNSKHPAIDAVNFHLGVCF